MKFKSCIYCTHRCKKFVLGGAFHTENVNNPFHQDWGKGANAGCDYHDEWIVAEKKPIYDEIFLKLGPVNGKLYGSEAKKVFILFITCN